jgi:hypothetical protein
MHPPPSALLVPGFAAGGLRLFRSGSGRILIGRCAAVAKVIVAEKLLGPDDHQTLRADMTSSPLRQIARGLLLHRAFVARNATHRGGAGASPSGAAVASASGAAVASASGAAVASAAGGWAASPTSREGGRSGHPSTRGKPHFARRVAEVATPPLRRARRSAGRFRPWRRARTRILD